MNLADLGWDPGFWREAVEEAKSAHGEVVVGRVAADFGVEHRVVGEFGDERVTLTGKLRFEVGVRPAVGDWVLLTGAPGAYTVLDLLPRRTWLARQASGKKTGIQTIAANVDVVFVVTSFNEDFNFNRIERYLTAIHDGGGEGVVVVNKSDLVSPEVRADTLAELRERLPNVEVIDTSALEGAIVDRLRSWLRPQRTASFVGSSGVGKSTIVNALLGESKQATFEVRSDAKGRHTTTHRELFFLDSGAIVIDTPGMREFQLWDEGSALDAFDDIVELATQCRFRDCKHESEPGCAVAEAVESGELTEQRVESWRKLTLESEQQAIRANEAARRQQDKDFAKITKEAQQFRKRKRK